MSVRLKTGGMQKGFKYDKRKFWYNNTIVETLIFDGDPIPEGFIKGRLKRGIVAWNKGLTKEIDLRLAKMSQTKSNKKPRLKYSDEYLIENYISNNILYDYWQDHTFIECCKYFGISDYVFRRVLKLANISSEDIREHAYRLTWTDARRKALSEKLKGKNVWSKGSKHSQSLIDKFKLSHSLRTDELIKASKHKEHLTKIKNGTYFKNMNKSELFVQNILLKYFTADDLCYQYTSDVYPFVCDFYIKSEDLYLELNFYPSHGKHKFTGSQEDLDIVNSWKLKADLGKKQYLNWIYTWTDLDVRKFKCVENNLLNFIAVYNKNDFENVLNEYIKNKKYKEM